jgi:hypothetical protein
MGVGPDFNASMSYATGGFNLFYGLLLGLLTVAAYQNNERVRESVLAEATALSALYADMNSFPIRWTIAIPSRSSHFERISSATCFIFASAIGMYASYSR